MCIERILNKVAGLETEIDRLKRLNANLLNGEVPVCGDCDGTGWQENRVEGRYPCTCMTEAEPYQLLLAELDRLTAENAKLQRAVDRSVAINADYTECCDCLLPECSHVGEYDKCHETYHNWLMRDDD